MTGRSEGTCGLSRSYEAANLVTVEALNTLSMQFKGSSMHAFEQLPVPSPCCADNAYLQFPDLNIMLAQG